MRRSALLSPPPPPTAPPRNATVQAFSGYGCSVTPRQSCACLRVADGAAQRDFKYGVTAPRPLYSIPSRGILSTFRFFLYVVTVIFGCMHVCAALSLLLDRRDRAAALERLQDPDRMGFRQQGGDGGWLEAGRDRGVWTWALAQHPLVREADAVRGPLVAFSGELGLPLARLRAFIPEDMLPGSIALVTGRRGGFSPSWLQRNRDSGASSLAAVVRRLYGGSGAAGGGGCCGCLRGRTRVSADPSQHGGKLNDSAEFNTKRIKLNTAQGAQLKQFSTNLMAAEDPSAAPSTLINNLMGGPLDGTAPASNHRHELVSTALAFSLIAVRRLLPADELVFELDKASIYFKNVDDGFGRDFDTLHYLFIGLLTPRNIPAVRIRRWQGRIARSSASFGSNQTKW